MDISNHEQLTSTHDKGNDELSATDHSKEDTLHRGNVQRGSPLKKITKLSHMAKEFRRIVDCRDRKWNFTVYKNSFIGCDAVDSLIYAGLCESREEAVAVGKRLMEELHLFHHVAGDHEFKGKKQRIVNPSTNCDYLYTLLTL